MEAWIFAHEPLERWMDDYQRIFDAWSDGGVRGLVLGRLNFRQDDGTGIPTFRPDPDVYRSFGVEPPADAPQDLDKEKTFDALIGDAAARGWRILFFGARGGGSLPLSEDPFGAVGFAAGVQATMNRYPEVHGVIIDGPGENHYELAFHHGGELFEIRDHERERWRHLDVDVDRLERGMEHLRARFHQLTPDVVRYWASGGLLAGLHLFDVDEDALYWLRTRRQTSLGFMKAIRERIDGLDRKVELGGIPRTAAFSSLTGQDYQQMPPYFDYIFPKHYYWHRGFDGLYGTVARWVQRLGVWNPALSEADCFAVVKSLFGIDLPKVHSLMDMEGGFPQEFFSDLVYGETRRALEAIGEDKTIAWVSTGRSPHAGDAMPARDLQGILTASERAGLKRFLFHPDPDLGAPEWSVISSMCGNPWRGEEVHGYWPGDTPRLDSFSGGRKRERPD